MFKFARSLNSGYASCLLLIKRTKSPSITISIPDFSGFGRGAQTQVCAIPNPYLADLGPGITKLNLFFVILVLASFARADNIHLATDYEPYPLAQIADDIGFPADVQRVGVVIADHMISRDQVTPRVPSYLTMPIASVQGANDPGQRPEEYFRTASTNPNGQVLTVDANHFIQSEKPKLVADVARGLFQ
ncbi:MAG: hypothetical protein AAFR02_07685 [Pseudomonadota bacterium]